MKAQLRTHPKLKYKGARTWPPDWSGGYNGAAPQGEEGRLEDVFVVERDYIGPQRLELTNNYDGRRLCGQVWLDDPALAPRLCEILKKHVGSPMKDIGQLEIDL